MALRCYPLQPGGLLAIEAVLHRTDDAGERLPGSDRRRSRCILLLIFMVAGIYFLRDLLLYRVHEAAAARALARRCLSLTFCAASARAVGVSRRADRGRGDHHGRPRLLRGVSPRRLRQASRAPSTIRRATRTCPSLHREDLEQFRAFLRGLMMHGAVGTAIGGVDDAGRRAAEPADRQAGRVEFRRVLPRDGARSRCRSRSPASRPAGWSSGCGCSATARELPDATSVPCCRTASRGTARASHRRAIARC